MKPGKKNKKGTSSKGSLHLSVVRDGENVDEQQFGGPTVDIGRAPDVHLKLDDPYISGTHCTIKIKDNEVYLLDHGSTNGTLLNGHRVKKVKINDGDAIKVGHTFVVVRFLNGLSAHAKKNVQTPKMDSSNQTTNATASEQSLAKFLKRGGSESTAIEPKTVVNQQAPVEVSEVSNVSVRSAKKAEDMFGAQAVRTLKIDGEEYDKAMAGVFDPNSFDENQQDYFDRNFEEPFALVKKLTKGEKEKNTSRSERQLQIMEYVGDSIIASDVIEQRNLFKVLTEGGRRRLAKSERGGFVLYFANSDGGHVLINGRKMTLASLAKQPGVDQMRGGLNAAHLDRQDEAYVDIEGKTFCVRFVDKQHLPVARLSLRPSREMGKMVGISILTHVLAMFAVRVEAEAKKARANRKRKAKT
jgi:pSer/pThr/pTyr-binding forkhead associated (FHA) protein